MKTQKPFFVFCLLFFLFPVLHAQTKADTIHVVHYNINLEIRDFTQQKINGFTELEIEAKVASLPCIYLHFTALLIDSVIHDNNAIDFFHQGEQLKINLPFINVGERKTIRVYYQGQPFKESWGGFFFSGDFAYNIGVGMDSYPHSFGRVWYPCIDEFTDKSTYTFNITTDADKKAICGGMLKDSVDLGDKMIWKWELEHPIPTYLASVAVGKYLGYKDTVLSVSGNILPIEIYADATVFSKIADSFVNLKKFIHTYEKRWGACRWQRVGYVAVPFGGGAMEHATNIAYPRSSINGNTNSQDLISHELAHAWFGNLITCSSSNNMWINEGFSTYGEYLCHETLDPTLQKYNTEIRKLHMEVLKKEGGKYALDNVPPDDTYNQLTTYKKGGLVAYTLRHYMGDELYFSSISQFLDENRYKNVNSEEFFDKLSQISNMNLHDFFLGWVHQPGFLNFNIDSIKHLSGSTYQIAWKQRLQLAEYFANNNKVDVEFVSESGERYLLEKINFSGEHDIVEKELPFEPVFWAIDPNFKMGDACYDYSLVLNKAGSTTLSDAMFKVDVSAIEGESILRIEHNLFAPTPTKNYPQNILRISEKRFWRVGFLQYKEMQAQYSFQYNTSFYDKELLNGYSYENLVLLYRKDAAHEWQIIPATVVGINTYGTLTTTFVLPGEYTLGIGDKLKIQEWENNIKIYPNPTNGELRFTNYDLRIENVEFFDVFGRRVVAKSSSNSLEGWQPQADGVVLNISHLPAGTYLLLIQTDNGTIYRKVFKK